MTETLEYTGKRRAPAPNVQGVEVGDLFYSSWGYDQTNVDFYVVVGLTAKMVKIRQVGSKRVDDSHVEPDPSRFVDEGAGWCPNCRQGVRARTDGTLLHWATTDVRCTDAEGRYLDTVAEPVPPTVMLKRVRTYSGEPTLSLTSYSNAYPYKGGGKYCTPFGFGH